jgi:hypothetical protein
MFFKSFFPYIFTIKKATTQVAISALANKLYIYNSVNELKFFLINN